MIIEITLALIIGILAGTITGLSPGIHINLVASLLIASLSLPLFAPISLLSLAIFIVSMSITHTFIDFIPSIYLGAPDEDTFLSILPGHQMMREGLARSAFVITLYGSFFALPVILIFTPLFINFLPIIYTTTKSIIPYLLIFLSFYLIFREDNFLPSLVIFLLAGFLGLFTFNLPVQEPLLPLLSGLFGLSSLILSLKSNTIPSKQTILPLKEIRMSKSELTKGILASALISPFFSFLPGIGSGHATTISSEFFNLERKSFLFVTGAVNTIIMGLSFITLYTIGKSRTGSASAVKDLLQTLTMNHIYIILIIIIISSLIAFFLGIQISKLASKFINLVNYKYLTLVIITILIIVNLILSNWLGIIVLVTATSLGIFTFTSNSRRINLMSALIVPAIVYYLIN